MDGSYPDVFALAVDSLGNLYAGGNFTSAGGIPANRIARWNGSTTWAALDSGLNGDVYALTTDYSGNLYAGGDFTTAGGIAANYIAKWNGKTWAALGSGMAGPYQVVRALIVDSSGNLYAGGSFTNAGGIAVNYVANWNGSAWSALGSGMDNDVCALAVDRSGNLYAGGGFTTVGGITAANDIAKWNGSAWSSLGSGMNDWVFALTTDDSGNLYAGGGFTTAGGKVSAYTAYAILSPATNSTYAVTNVVATPRWPWDGKVDIAYEVLADDPEIELWVNFAGRDLDRNLVVPMRTLTGDGAEGPVPAWPAVGGMGCSGGCRRDKHGGIRNDSRGFGQSPLHGGRSFRRPVGHELPGDATCPTCRPAVGRTSTRPRSWCCGASRRGTFTMGSPSGRVGAQQWRDPAPGDADQGLLHRGVRGDAEAVGAGDGQLAKLLQQRHISRHARWSRSATTTSGRIRTTAPISPNWPQSSQVHADSFMGKLRAKTGLATFDLPTEAQWEYACRAGTTTALNSGQEPDGHENLPEHVAGGAVLRTTAVAIPREHESGTAKVGMYLPNAWGLYDMHGNVGEWCLDWYGPFSDWGVQDPPGWGSGDWDPLGPHRVSRGGSYVRYAQYCRSADRGWVSQEYASTRRSYRGLPCCKVLVTTSCA